MTDCAVLEDRKIIRIKGADAVHFLQGIVTCDVDHLAPGEAAFGALLSPQGKIMFDFFLIRTEEGFLADAPAQLADDLAKRLGFYKLRAKVDIEPDDSIHVTAFWGGEPADAGGTTVRDPRHEKLGWRQYGKEALADCARDYDAHRIGLGVPQGGSDFAYGDAFPHDALMDEMNAVAFTKGCFIGQEVVSRMRHRGTARKRVVMIEADAPLPGPQTAVTAGGKPAGETGSASANRGLALLRLDRIKPALDEGADVLAGDTPVRVTLQPWVSFGWPADKGGD